jgi:hypothetical protein
VEVDVMNVNWPVKEAIEALAPELAVFEVDLS